MRNQSSRYEAGYVSIFHKGHSMPTTVGSREYETQYTGVRPPKVVNLKVGKIPSGYEHRPDLISSLFYSSPVGWWKVVETNNVFDIFEQLNSGEYIYLPKR